MMVRRCASWRMAAWLFFASMAMSVAGCRARSPTVTLYPEMDQIHGAFLSSRRAYLLGGKQDFELDPGPFRAHRALADSPLGASVRCVRMEATVTGSRSTSGNEVEGRYTLAWPVDAVEPALAARFGLQQRPAAALPREMFARSGGPCPLAADAMVYVASFAARGRTVVLQDREALLSRARLPRPVPILVSQRTEGKRPVSPGLAVAAVFLVPLYFLMGGDSAEWR